MSMYTTQLRYYIESGGELFDFSYPIFDDNYKSVLEQKIIDTYYFREIGFETVALFKHYLKVRLNNIMPYYNQLYDSLGLVDKENYNINLDNTITRTNKTESDGNNTTSGNDQSIFSDTPQGRLGGEDYATNLTEGNTSTTSNGSSTTLEEYTEHLLGNGSMRYNADILMEWRESFINVDMMVIDELADLFMGIY